MPDAARLNDDETLNRILEQRILLDRELIRLSRK